MEWIFAKGAIWPHQLDLIYFLFEGKIMVVKLIAYLKLKKFKMNYTNMEIKKQSNNNKNNLIE